MTGRRRTLGAKFEASERGSTLLLVTLFIFVLFGFTAISIDVSRVYIEKYKVHMATDAGALAGAAKIGDPTVPTQLSDAITEADVIANTNGVTDAEIAAGAVNGYPGQIQVGEWLNSTFNAGTTPYNAVRVPAKRTVPMYFGKVVGLSQMTPAVDSVALIGARPIPYGVPACALAGLTNGGTFVLENWGNLDCSKSAGNWGPLDLCGKLKGSKDVTDALTGPGCYSTVGQSTPVSTGFDGVAEGFKGLCDQIIVLPVTDNFPTGSSSSVTIQNYIVVKVLCPVSNSGFNFQVNVQFLGIGFSTLRQYGLGPSRGLAE